MNHTGAIKTINSKSDDLHETLSAFTEGHGPDVVIEAIGVPGTYRAAVDEVAYTGPVVYIGWAKEPVTYETRPFVHKELDILGSRNAMPEDFREVIGMLEAKQFPVDAAVTHTVPFAGTRDSRRVGPRTGTIYENHDPGELRTALQSGAGRSSSYPIKTRFESSLGDQTQSQGVIQPQ